MGVGRAEAPAHSTRRSIVGVENPGKRRPRCAWQIPHVCGLVPWFQLSRCPNLAVVTHVIVSVNLWQRILLYCGRTARWCHDQQEPPR